MCDWSNYSNYNLNRYVYGFLKKSQSGINLLLKEIYYLKSFAKLVERERLSGEIIR